MDDARIKRLQKALTVDCLMVDHPSDLFYLTGISFSVGRLAVFPDHATLLIDERYFGIAQQKAPCAVKKGSEWAKEIQEATRVGFDSAFVTYDGYQSMATQGHGKQWIPIASPLKQIRALKEPGEIQALRQAARLTWEGFQHVAALLQEGVAEEALAREFTIYCLRHGAKELSFPPIVAFGPNTAFPHHHAGPTRLQKNQAVLFDLGAKVDGYAGDMTRVVFFGHPDPQLARDYQLIQTVQAAVIAAIRPDVRFGDLDRMARQALRQEGVEDLFVHGLSHGVGLDVHEYPRLRKEGGEVDLPLLPTMVFTVEPGLYRPGIGGVRYEDTVLVTAKGVENFTPEFHAKV